MERDLDDIVAQKTRAYAQQGGKRVALQLFSKNTTLLDQLCLKFGGQSYRHGSGRLWIVGKRETLMAIVEVVEAKLGDERPERLLPLFAYAERIRNPDAQSANGSGDHPQGEGGDDQSLPTRPSDEGGG